MNKKLTLLFLALLTVYTSAWAQVTQKSPDGLLTVKVAINENMPYYSIKYKNKTYLEDSPLGLITSRGDYSKNLKYISSKTSVIKESYTINRAKVSSVNYNANELICSYETGTKDTLKIHFKVSNNNVAFSYVLIPGGKKSNSLVVNRENTGFKLPSYSTTFITPQATAMMGWEQTKPSYEEKYTYNEPVGTPSAYKVGYTFPALFKIGENGWVLISETGVDSRYVASRLGESSKDGLYMLEFPMEGENKGMGPAYATAALPLQTPWRTITVGETLKPIVETTVSFDVVKPLYEPAFDYKPGRASWSWIVWQDNSINYKDQVEFIDLAAALNFEYVLVDAGWDVNIGREKMTELVNYAKSKNVAVVLWYNSNGYWNNAPQTPKHKMHNSPARKAEMAWLQSIGVKGLKVDFFGGDKQETMKLYEDILSDANDYGLAITFHGCTLPRGWERMYPNFVTSEAVLASENLVFTQAFMDNHAYNATILPFTRNTVAAMDFAPVFLNPRLSKNQKSGTIRRTTDAFELATAILYFSPIQHYGLTPNNLSEQPSYVWDFVKKTPTTWDETLFIDGYPGKHCVIARRKGANWYIAAVNGEKTDKKITVRLPMLQGKEAILLFDEASRQAGKKSIKINSKGTITLNLLSEGGAVIYTE